MTKRKARAKRRAALAFIEALPEVDGSALASAEPYQPKRKGARRSAKMSVLQQMTESMFSETLKRIAEDVWKEKFKAAAGSISRNGSYNNHEVLKRMITEAFIEALAKDAELRKALTDAVHVAAIEYFSGARK